MTLRTTTFSIRDVIVTLSIMTLSIMTLGISIKCHYALCRVLFIVKLNFIMLSFLILSVIVLIVNMLNVIRLSVVAPLPPLILIKPFFAASFKLKLSKRISYSLNITSCSRFKVKFITAK